MLIEFSVGNYRSFKDTVTFSAIAAPLVAKDPQLDEQNVFAANSNLSLLKSAAIYGANASGKSNLIAALRFMLWFAINSSKETQSTEKIDVEPFRLNTVTEGKPSHFELVFLCDDRQFRYGFEVTRDRVVSEWLFYVPNQRETRLFERDDDTFKCSKKYQANGLQQRTRHNALFLSVSAQFNVAIAEKILDWLTEKLKTVSGLDDTGYRGYTTNCLLKQQYHADITNLLVTLDLGFDNVKVQELEFTLDSLPADMPEELKQMIIKESGGKLSRVQTVHRQFDTGDHPIKDILFDLDDQESEGTRKVFALAGPLVDTLRTGKILVVDEFDARLHPLIGQAIVSLFNSTETNPHNAQLIFATHDTNLLSPDRLRRDQIWFVEKDRYGATDLYSLAEYKGVRNDEAYEKNYIQGRYGAIPYLGNVGSLMQADG